jgi:hypothetical protein
MNKSFAILFGAVLAAGVTSVGCQSNEGAAASQNGGDTLSTVIDTRGADKAPSDNAAVDNKAESQTDAAPTANVGTDSQSDASADARNEEGENYAKPQDHDYEAKGGEADAGETSVIDTGDAAKTEPVADVSPETGTADSASVEGDAPDAGVKNSGADTDKGSDAGTSEATPDSGAATSND